MKISRLDTSDQISMLSSRPGEHVRISSLPAQFCRTKTNCSPSQCNEASPSSKCSPGGQSAARNNRRQVRVSASAVYCPCPSQIIRISSPSIRLSSRTGCWQSLPFLTASSRGRVRQWIPGSSSAKTRSWSSSIRDIQANRMRRPSGASKVWGAKKSNPLSNI